MTRCVLCIVEVTGTFRVWEEGGRGGAGGCRGGGRACRAAGGCTGWPNWSNVVKRQTCDGARAGEPADDWTNRAPFPTLHLLREARVEVAPPSPYTCSSPCFDAPALQRHRLGFLRLLSVGIRVLPEVAHLSQEALDGFTEPEEVWQRNVRVMREKGVGFMRALVAGCLRG